MSSHSNRRLFGKIAKEYNLVYFGNVNPKVDTDYKMVRGVTVSPDVRDENYTVGTVGEHEIVFLERTHKVEVARGKWNKYHWTMLQITVKDIDIPHIFVDSFYRRTTIGNLIMSVLRLPEIPWQNFSPDANFSKAFTLYARPHAIQFVRKLFMIDMQKNLMEDFYKFDFELFNDKIIVYATNQKIDLPVLHHMLRAGLLLAKKIEDDR